MYVGKKSSSQVKRSRLRAFERRLDDNKATSTAVTEANGAWRAEGDDGWWGGERGEMTDRGKSKEAGKVTRGRRDRGGKTETEGGGRGYSFSHRLAFLCTPVVESGQQRS